MMASKRMYYEARKRFADVLIRCSTCYEKMTFEMFHKHVLNEHNVNALHECPYCFGKFRWTKGEKMHEDTMKHLVTCLQSFMEKNRVPVLGEATVQLSLKTNPLTEIPHEEDDCSTDISEIGDISSETSTWAEKEDDSETDDSEMDDESLSILESNKRKEETCKAMDDKSKKLKMDNYDSISENNFSRREYYDMRQEYDDLKRGNHEQRQENDDLKRENYELRQERDTLKRGNDALRQENDALRQENDALRQENDALKRENDDLKQNTKNQLEKEKKQLEREWIPEWEQRCMEIYEKYKKEKMEKDVLKLEKEVLKSENDALKLENDILKSCRWENSTEIHDMKHEFDILKRGTHNWKAVNNNCNHVQNMTINNNIQVIPHDSQQGNK